jgi:hypothetical protein
MPDVRFGSKADVCAANSHVRFTPESGHVRCTDIASVNYLLTELVARGCCDDPLVRG